MASMIMNRTWTLSTRERRAERRPASIICPVDFSERDLVALRYAAQMARQRRGKLIVVHVVPNEEISDAFDALDAPGNTACEVALAQLERFVPLQPGVQCEWVVLRGDVADQLVELATGCDAPQIVMATRVRKNAGRAFMGHTAEAVLRQAPCPVVMVNDEDLTAVRQTADSIHQYGYAAS
jgi:nucleotide-binding universal stress UspA family protein